MPKNTSCAMLMLVLANLAAAQPVTRSFELLAHDDVSIRVSSAEVVCQSGIDVQFPPDWRTSLGRLPANHPVVRVTVSTNRPWIRLRFEQENTLGSRSVLIVRSASRSTQQTFTSDTLAAWGGRTVVFGGGSDRNGAAAGAEVELLYLELDSGPGSPTCRQDSPDATQLKARASTALGRDRFKIVGDIRRVTEPPLPEPVEPTDLCVFGQDRRRPSAHPWIGRIFPHFCSAFMIDSNKFLTAGHCTVEPGSSLVQFNISRSNQGDDVASEDEYLIIKVQKSGGADRDLGKDWAIFSVAPNTETGQLPSDRYKGHFSIPEDPQSFVQELANGDCVTVAGYGSHAVAEWHNTQTSHTGQLDRVEGSSLDPVLWYKVDATGDSSGAPVLVAGSDFVIGIHTNGGCSDGSPQSGNKGTAIYNELLMTAIEEFTPE